MIRIGLDILKTYVSEKTKSVLLQLGDVKSETVDCDEVEHWSQPGFLGRASKARKGVAACQAIVADVGGRLAAFAFRDLRGQELAGDIHEGEACMYAGGEFGEGQARVICKANGKITLYTTDDNTASGTAVFLAISPTAFTFSAPWGRMIFDASGWHCITQSGARIDMGGVSIPGIPSSLSGPLTAYCKITAPTVTVNGGVVKLGPGPAYGLCLQAPSSAYTTPLPVTTGPTSQCGGVLVSTP